VTLFSANLGFLWADLPLPEAILAAKEAGFDAVECHWPFDTPPDDVKTALSKTGLKMIGLNTPKGDGFGLSALDDLDAARAAIDTAISYAAAIDCANIHVMAGLAEGMDAHAAFCQNLIYATQAAAPHGITVLIEPINNKDVPGYFLTRTAQALAIIDEIGAPNLKLMFDAYHVAMMEGEVMPHLDAAYSAIGHIQFAGVPTRGVPDEGDVDYAQLFAHLKERGYDQPLGAEYKPANGDTAGSLGWMARLRS
jgi:hydroxypyruvate isomerase